MEDPIRRQHFQQRTALILNNSTINTNRMDYPEDSSMILGTYMKYFKSYIPFKRSFHNILSTCEYFVQPGNHHQCDDEFQKYFVEKGMVVPESLSWEDEQIAKLQWLLVTHKVFKDSNYHDLNDISFKLFLTLFYLKKIVNEDETRWPTIKICIYYGIYYLFSCRQEFIKYNPIIIRLRT